MKGSHRLHRPVSPINGVLMDLKLAEKKQCLSLRSTWRTHLGQVLSPWGHFHNKANCMSRRQAKNSVIHRASRSTFVFYVPLLLGVFRLEQSAAPDMGLRRKLSSVFSKSPKTSSTSNVTESAADDVSCLNHADRAHQLECKVWRSTFLAAYQSSRLRVELCSMLDRDECHANSSLKLFAVRWGQLIRDNIVSSTGHPCALSAQDTHQLALSNALLSQGLLLINDWDDAQGCFQTVKRSHTIHLKRLVSIESLFILFWLQGRVLSYFGEIWYKVFGDSGHLLKSFYHTFFKRYHKPMIVVTIEAIHFNFMTVCRLQALLGPSDSFLAWCCRLQSWMSRDAQKAVGIKLASDIQQQSLHLNLLTYINTTSMPGSKPLYTRKY